MNIDREIREFKNYFDTFNKEDEKLKYKFEHTLRVIDITREICENEEFDEGTTKLCLISSLLHDIARFEQYTKYNTYDDLKSIDHGLKGYEILTNDNYILNYVSKENMNKVLFAVLNHNKYEIPNSNDKLAIKICKVVRDADKIDIMQTQLLKKENGIQYNVVDMSNKSVLNQEIINNFLEEKMLLNSELNNECCYLINQLAYLYDINFRSSFRIIYKYKLVDEKLELLKDLLLDNKQYNIIKIKINDYLESNIKL